MKILAIAGSLREKSFNKQLAQLAKESASRLYPHVEFELLSWGDLPLFNQDIEFPTPEPVKRIREEVKSAQGVWIFTPEYNYSYPGVLKNLIDWLSRPVSDTEKQVLIGKPIAFSGASIGQGGTRCAQEHLVALLSAVNMKVMNYPRLALANIDKQADEEEHLVLNSSLPYLERQLDAFIQFIEK